MQKYEKRKDRLRKGQAAFAKFIQQSPQLSTQQTTQSAQHATQPNRPSASTNTVPLVLPPGTTVQLAGLVSRVALNGQTAQIREYNFDKQRYIVCMHLDQEVLSVKPECVTSAELGDLEATRNVNVAPSPLLSRPPSVGEKADSGDTCSRDMQTTDRFKLVDEKSDHSNRRYRFKCPDLGCPNNQVSVLTPWLVSSSNKFRCPSTYCREKKQNNYPSTIPACVMKHHLNVKSPL